MLDTACYNMALFSAPFELLVFHHSFQRPVVRFSSSCSKINLLRTCMQHICDLLSRMRYRIGTLLSQLVRRRRIPIAYRKIWFHCLVYLRTKGSGSSMIQVYIFPIRWHRDFSFPFSCHTESLHDHLLIKYSAQNLFVNKKGTSHIDY